MLRLHRYTARRAELQLPKADILFYDGAVVAVKVHGVGSYVLDKLANCDSQTAMRAHDWLLNSVDGVLSCNDLEKVVSYNNSAIVCSLDYPPPGELLD